MIYQDIKRGRFYNADCFDAMKEIPDGVIDMILCDLPYGTTQNKWDSVIPFEPLWKEYWRVCKPNAAIVLTAAQPFTSALVMSQPSYFKYSWIWQKESGTGLLNSKKQPLRDHEDVLVFYKNQSDYNPQYTEGKPYAITKGGETSNYNKSGTVTTVNEGKRYPKTVQKFNRDKDKSHPTQKPVALFEYLIKTYTDENMIVLDNTAGSGTTAIAAINTNRKWVCIEKDEDYYTKAIQRIINHNG